MAYGRTVVTSDPFWGETEDDSVTLLQWCAHTLQTRRGTLRTARDHGIDLPGLLLAPLTPEAQVSIPADVKAALERGRRVRSVEVESTTEDTARGKRMRLRIAVHPVSGGDPLQFTYASGEDLAAAMSRGA